MHWREAITSKLSFKHQVPLPLMESPHQTLCRDMETDILSRLGPKADAWDVWDTSIMGTTFPTCFFMLLLWLLERNGPFQMSHFRLRWGTAQQTDPSIHSANPHWAEETHCPGYPKIMCWCSQATKFLPSGDDNLGGAQLCHWPLPAMCHWTTLLWEMWPPAWQKGNSSLAWFLATPASALI